MPDLLLRGLTAQQAADLLEYLDNAPLTGRELDDIARAVPAGLPAPGPPGDPG